MGLLDEAIREHLELRRQRGVDPGELARDEEAALGAAGELVDRSDDDLWDESPGAVASAEVRPGVAVGVGGREASLYASQETVEIDMTTILGIEADDADAPSHISGEANRDVAASVSAGAAGRAPSFESELDQLDWEVSRARPLAGRTPRDNDLGQ